MGGRPSSPCELSSQPGHMNSINGDPHQIMISTSILILVDGYEILDMVRLCGVATNLLQDHSEP